MPTAFLLTTVLLLPHQARADDTDAAKLRQYSADLRAFTREVRALADLSVALPDKVAMDRQLKKVQDAARRLNVPSLSDARTRNALDRLRQAAAKCESGCKELPQQVEQARKASQAGKPREAALMLDAVQQARQNLRRLLERIEESIGSPPRSQFDRQARWSRAWVLSSSGLVAWDRRLARAGPRPRGATPPGT